MPGFLVLDVPEFAPLLDAARAQEGTQVKRISAEYWQVMREGSLDMTRAKCGLCEAVWFGAFTAGLLGRIETLDAERLRIVEARSDAGPA